MLNDQQLQTAYKRLVVLIAVAGTVQYKLPAAKITFTAAEVSEVVLDADSRLMSPGHFEQIRAHQLEAFRRLLLDIYPDAKDRVQFYAFRAGSSNGSSKQDGTFQCIVKLPQSIRRDILSLSGTQGLLIRDYINRNAMPSDLTVLPKFWTPSGQSLHDMIIITKANKGFGGVCSTKRGLAARAWTDHVAELRKAVMAGDNRITMEYIAVVPRVTLQSTGWPPASEPKDIISATKKATGLAPIPSKAFRLNGVFGWTLSFEKKPSIMTFTIEINGRPHEVLLVEDAPYVTARTSPKNPPKKRDGKTQPVASPTQAVTERFPATIAPSSEAFED